MAEQDLKKKPKIRPSLTLPSPDELEQLRSGQAISPDVTGMWSPQTEEERKKAEEWRQSGVLTKLGRKAKVGWIDMTAGIQRSFAEVLPLMSKLPAGFPGGGMIDPEYAYVSSQYVKQKALETLERRKEINAPSGDWTDIASMAPLMAGITASALAAPVTGGTSLAVIPALIGEGTMLALTASVYGNSLLEQEMYSRDTGKDISEFTKQSVAMLSAAAMLVAGRVVGSGSKAINKTLGDAISTTIKEAPDLATSLMRRYIAETPGAAQKLIRFGKTTAAEALKSGTAFGAMTIAQDFAANIYKYPEDRLRLEEIITNAANSFKGGLLFGSLIGGVMTGQSSMYNYLRRKNSGINVVQTRDGQVYERIGDHPTDKNKVMVMDKKMNFKDVNRDDIIDGFSMTVAEKEQYLDAYKTHEESLPGIEEAIKRNAVKRQAKDLTSKLVFNDIRSRKPGIGPLKEFGNNVLIYEAGGEKFFIKNISGDGRLAEGIKVVPRGDGTYDLQRFMIKNFDAGKVTMVPAESYSQMLFDYYTNFIESQPKQEYDPVSHEPVDPIKRQEAQDKANKTTKVGEEIKYMGRTWEVEEIGFDGSVKVIEIKENGEYGEKLDIPAGKIEEINKEVKEPELETVKVDGKEVQATPSAPIYEKDGKPVTKAYIKGILRTAKSPDAISGMRWSNDPELDKMFKAKFPEAVQTYKIGKDEVEKDEIMGAIDAATDIADLKGISVILDPEVQTRLDQKLAELQPVIKKPAEKKVRTPEQVIVESMTEQEYIEGKLSKLAPSAPEETRKTRAKEYKAEYRQMKAAAEKPPEEPAEKAPEEEPEFKAVEMPVEEKPAETKPKSVKQQGAEAYLKELQGSKTGEMEVTFPEEIAKGITEMTGVKVIADKEKGTIRLAEAEKPEEKPSEQDKDLLRIATEDALDRLKAGKQSESKISKDVELLKKNIDVLPENSKIIARKWLDEHGFGGKPEVLTKEGKIAAKSIIENLPLIKTEEKPVEVTDRTQVEAKIAEIKAKPDYPQKAEDLAFYEHKLELIEKPIKEAVEGGQKPAEQINKEIGEARKDVEPEPSDAQKEAGNYPKGHLDILGMQISIETAKGGIRRSKANAPKKWEITMNNDYGHILGTEGADGDLLDVFLGQVKPGQDVYIIDQANPETLDFDEHKVMLGFDSAQEAKKAYLSNYEEGWKGFGAIAKKTIEEFKEWAFDKTRTKKPLNPNIHVKGKVQEQVQPSGRAEGEVQTHIVSGGTETGIERVEGKGEEELRGINKIVRDRFAKALTDNYDLYKDQYLSKFGNVISGDLAKTLSPDFRANPGKFSQVVHEPASDFAKKLYDDLITNPAPEEQNYVLMTAGGTGAGKTTIKDQYIGDKGQPFLVYDSNMANFETSRGRIEKALDNNKEVDLIYVWRDPYYAYLEGVLPRILQEGPDKGRDVSVDNHIKTHVKSLANIKKIYDLYKDNDNVSFRFYDNDIQNYVNPETIFAKNIDAADLKRRLQNDLSKYKKEGPAETQESIVSGQTYAEDQRAYEEAPEGGRGPEAEVTPTFPAEETVKVSKPEFAGKAVEKYTPFDAWDQNLMKTRDYARHLWSVDELNALTAAGTLDWKNLDSIVKAINAKLAAEKKPTFTKLPRSYFETELWNYLKDNPEIQKAFEDNANDPQNQRIAVEHKVRLIITDYYVENIDRIISTYNKPETYEGLFQQLTDRLYEQRTYLKKPEFAGERITRAEPVKMTKLTPEQEEIEKYKALMPRMPLGKKGAVLRKNMLRAIPMLPKLKPGDWYRSGEMGETIMPFIVEAQNLGSYYRVFPDPDAYMLILSHYYEQNGDLMSDPSMEVVIYPAYGIAMPVSFEQHGFAGGYRQYVREGLVNEKGMNDGFSFLNQWLKNLEAQGRTLKETDKLSENGDRRKSIETIENKATAIANEAEDVADREQAGQISEEIDRQIEEIDSQLMLLPEHTVPEGFENEYPHKGIVPGIKKDVKKFSQEIAKLLGWEHDTDHKGKIEYCNVNIAPAGGGAHFILWKPGSDLGVYVKIPYEPTEMTGGGGYGETYGIRGILQNQGYGPILWRLTTKKNKYSGMNNQWIGNVDAGELARAIKKLADSYEKSDNKRNFDNLNVTYEKPTTPYRDKGISDTSGDGGPEVSGGMEPAEGGGPVQPEQTPRTPRKGGGKGREADRPTAERRPEQGPSGGISDIQPVSTTEGGGPPEVVTGTPQTTAEYREQPRTIDDNHIIRPDDVIIPPGEITKIRANITAIELVRKLEKENRNATPQEKQVLVKYTGWGQLSAVFDKAKWADPQWYPEWHKKYGSYHKKLLELLTPDEFQMAINSTINAHYTTIPIIREMWKLAEQLGFRGGNVLEPAAGIGHFFGGMPLYLQDRSTLRAYELEGISGRIATKLYPRAKVNIKGYELSGEGIASQDLIITNVPFGKTAPFDAKNPDLSKFSLHNYFIAKGIRQLKPGGIGIFITSASTLDNAISTKFREWVVNEGNADMVGAIRLPNNAFAENAGTEVTTDIVIFRKRIGDQISPNAKDFRITVPIGDATNERGEPVKIEVNQYYADNPTNMLGKMMLAHEAGKGGLYTGDSQTLAPLRGQDMIKELADRIAKMPKGIMETAESRPPEELIAANDEEKNGTLINREGKFYEVVNGELAAVDWNDKTIKLKGKSYKAVKVATDYLGIKTMVNDLIMLEQLPDTDTKVIEDLRTKLNTAYDGFVKSYGTFNRNPGIKFLEEDSEFNSVAALENVVSRNELNKAGRNVKKYDIDKAAIFEERVNFPVIEPTTAENVEDALNISISYRQKVDLPYIASMLGMTEEQTTNELLEEGLVFRNPATEQIEDRETYLSGYVRTKYKTALEVSKAEPTYLKNVEALKAVVPKDLPGQLIKFQLGTPWIPPDMVKSFIKNYLDIDATVAYNDATGHWVVRAHDGQYGAKNKTSGTEDFTGFDLVDKALNLRTPRVVKTDYNWEGGRRVKTEKVDVEATAQAQGKMDEIMDSFINFIYDSKEFVDQIETVYNDKYNDYIEKSYNAPTFDYFPGASKSIKLMLHQKIGAIRGLKESLLFAMQVGTGKTFTMATTAMELRRLKLAKKPMIVVQNATLEQFANEYRRLYPAARLLVPTKNQMDAPKRQSLFNKIAYGDWDSIIIPQSFLDFIPDDPARERAYIQERIAELEQVLEEVDDGQWNNPVASDIKKSIETLQEQLLNVDNPKKKKTKKVKDIAKSNLAKESQLQKQASRRKDDIRLFEKMGVDALFVDEAHAYKKLGFATALQNIKGIDTKGSKRAFGLFMKIRFIQEKMKGRNVFLSTGTPITNTMAEVWTMMKYVAPDILKKHRIDTFDKFALTFGSIEPSLEFTAAGKFKIVKRFKAYKNAPELMNLFRANSYVVLTEDIPEFKESNTIPKLKNGEHTKVILPQTDGVKAAMANFKAILERWEKLPGREKRLNRHVPLVVFTRAKMAAIDLRLLNPSNPDEPGSKVNAVVKEVKRIYDETTSYKGTQLIFSDIYQSPDMGPSVERFDVYNDIKKKLINLGVPAEEIEIIREQVGTQREAIFDKINKGDIRVLMGSTQKLGMGVNVQTLLAAIHHMDAPDRPDKFEQRNGRLLRQGNLHAEWEEPVEVVTYGVEKTLDATAYQRLAIKQKFINQMMKGEHLDRETADAAAEEEATDMTFDQMMATLSGSQAAILWTQRSFELKKLLTAKRNYERGLIDAKKGLQDAKTIVAYLTDALTDVENAVELVKKHFKPLETKKEEKELRTSGLNVNSITFNGRQYSGEKMLEGFNTELAKEVDLFKNRPEAGRTAMLKINDIPIPVYISYDGRNDRFMYQVEPIQGSSAEAKVTGYFTSGAGFFQSLKIMYNNFLEGKLKDVRDRLAKHQKDIPSYEAVLKKTFDKQEKLDKTQMEVRDLEDRMKNETQADLNAPKPIDPVIWEEIGKLAMDEAIPEQMRKDANEASRFRRGTIYEQRDAYNGLVEKYPELATRFEEAIKEAGRQKIRDTKLEWLKTQVEPGAAHNERSVEVLKDYIDRLNKAPDLEAFDEIMDDLASKSSMIRKKFNEIDENAQEGDFDIPIDDSVEPEPVFLRRPKLDESELRDEITALEKKRDELYRQKADKIKSAKGNVAGQGLFAGEAVSKKEIKANVNRIIEEYDNQIAGVEAEIIAINKQLDTAIKENEGQRSIWDDPSYPKYRFIPGEFIGDQLDVMKVHEMMRRAKIMSNYTGVKIVVVLTKGDLPENIVKYATKQFGDLSKSSIPAVYDKANRKVYVVIEDTKSISDMVSNLSHEIFAHHGLVALLGKEAYMNVLQLVYRGMSPVDVVEIARNYKVPESDWKTVAEEYLGDMARENQMNPTLWQRIIAKIREWIRKLFNISMSKSEIINLLRKSRENLTKNKPRPEDFTNIGEYLDAMTAYTTKPMKAESTHGYGIHVVERAKIDESVARGNLDYRTYFAVAGGRIGRQSAEWIEKALVQNNFNYADAMNFLEAKMVKYAKSERYYKIVKDARSYLSDEPPMKQDALYTVLVGKGKTPQELNFMYWDKPVESDQFENILNQLDIEGKPSYGVTYKYIQSGGDLYKKIAEIYGSEREASLFLSRAGVDGMIYDEQAEGITAPIDTRKYVIYDNTPVDIINEIAFMRSQKPAFIGDHLSKAGQVYENKEKTKRNWDETLQGVREYLQDMNLPVRKFEEEVIKRGGLQPNDSKPYRDISLSFGRQETFYKEFVKTKMRPVMEGIVKIIRSGMPGENILPYIISKHAIERNVVMRAEELAEFIQNKIINPDDPDQKKLIAEFQEAIADKDYSGVMPFDKDNEFTNPDELAEVIVDEFEAAVPKPLIDELWTNMRDASSKILDYWEQGQQISPEDKQKYLDRFQYFVPLRGWREGAANELVYVRGEGFKKSLMHAEGRRTLAENPLVHVQNVAFHAIGELVDNEVKTSMLKLVMRNLTGSDLYDLVTIKKLYYIRVDLPDGSYEWEPTIDRPPQEMWDEPGRVATKIYNEHHKLRIPKQAREHEVFVRRNAGDVVIIFKDKMLPVAQSLNKRNFMYHNIFGKVKDARTMNQAVTDLSYMNNFLKATYTSWNVVFPFTNFMRDFQEASITQLIKGENGPGVIKNYNRSFPIILRFMLGKLDLNNPDDAEYKKFMDAGGPTGFTHLLSAEELERKLMKEISRMVGRGTVRGEIKHYGMETVEVISMWNQLFEDATRFSVYLTSRELGKTVEDAAYDAKEASINFNRKGKSSKTYDALYAFWNVAWQSVQKNSKLAKDYPKRFIAVASAFMALGFIEALLNKATDDENPENDYYNINPWMRENYLILPNIPALIRGESKGNKYLSIPLPQFWRGFKSVGSLAFDLIQGRIKPGEAVAKALLNFGASLSPVDPGGFGRNGEFSLAPLVPTVAKPFYEIATNRNYMGYTIAREPFDKAQEKLLAKARLGKDNVNPAAKFFTDMLFRWGGGDNNTKYYMSKTGEEKKVPFFLNVNPSFVEHLFKGYTGGTGAVFSDLMTTLSQVITPDQEVNFKNVPFVNRFIRQTPEEKWNVISDYYNLREKVSIHKGLKRQYTKQAEAGEDISQIEATEGAGFYEEYQGILDSYDSDISEMSKEIDFNDIEGSKPMYDLMKNCIRDINELKKKYNQ